jgi:hypothetical protein
VKSVIQRDDTYCYICKEKYGIDALQPTEEHHVFGGPLRPISEKNGLKVRLCHRHHTEGPEAVHRCQAMNRWLQKRAQIQFLQSHTKQEWMRIMHRDYAAAAYLKTPVDEIYDSFREEHPEYAKNILRWAPHPKEDHTIVMLLRIRGKEKPMRYTEAFKGKPSELKPLAALLFR